MEIENTKEATVIELKNNRVFIGVYIVPLFTLIGLIISKITIYSILVCLTIFVFLNIGNYIAIRNIGRNFDLKQCKSYNEKTKEK